LLRPIAVTALLSLLLPSVSIGQQRELPPLVERVEVTVVNVEVVVTDRTGRRIGGLKREDFTLYEDGRQQPLTNFYAAEAPEELVAPVVPGPAESAAAVAPRRQPTYLAVLVDSRSIHPRWRERVLGQVKEFISSSLQEGDEAMVAVWADRLMVPVPFTGDFARAAAAIAGVGTGVGHAVDAAEDRIDRDVAAQVETIEREVRPQAPMQLSGELTAMRAKLETLRKMAAVRGVMSRMAGYEGRKVLLFVTQKFPSCAVAVMGPCPAEFSLQGPLERLAADANARGVSLYTVYAGPNELGMATAERLRAPELAEHGDPMVRDLLSSSALETIARATGGLSAGGPDLANYLENVTADLSSYYSLGYRATRGSRSRSRSIRVAVANPDYSVRSRRALVEKSAADQISERLVSYVYDPRAERPAGELPFRVKLGAPKRQRAGRYLIPAELHIPFGQITLIEQARAYRGGVLVQFVTADHRGNLSPVTRLQFRLDLPAREVRRRAGTLVSYSVELLVDTRGERVAIAVTDEISGESGMQIVELPPL
jgi:VWFA-related protein